MTKYILHGGETGVQNEHNKAFYQEWVASFSDDYTPTILLTYYSRPRENWHDLMKSDQERFDRYTNGRKVNFVLANDDLDEFKNQVKESDVVYVRGGSSEKVIEYLRPIAHKLREMVDGKVYAGSSAGVMCVSHYARSNTSDWKKSLGILPINSIVHWNDDLQESLDNFRDTHQDNNYEYLLIPETEFIVKEFKL